MQHVKTLSQQADYHLVSNNHIPLGIHNAHHIRHASSPPNPHAMLYITSNESGRDNQSPNARPVSPGVRNPQGFR
ncbi:hypothetical protein INT44_002476 [Umbelopsis vinacea]|uniref:Uncharacterized protein n=1 Tax=Umbelopsis vinacea TaxID=44442 RepID=A0A8H7Q5K7_9FUNG|nr:hypothetical protein INT44_002476 [Umbelopsis vinacea]